MLMVATSVLIIGEIGALAKWRSLAAIQNLDRVRALARVHEFARAKALLENYLRVFPQNDRAHLLEAVELARELARLPKELAADPRCAKHEGIIVQIAQNWPTAANTFVRAFTFEPHNSGVCYRLLFVLRQPGDKCKYEHVN
jgi:hypothetical protein